MLEALPSGCLRDKGGFQGLSGASYWDGPHAFPATGEEQGVLGLQRAQVHDGVGVIGGGVEHGPRGSCEA